MRDFGDFYIIYPERRHVSAKWIHSMYRDALANGYIAEEYRGLNEVYINANPGIGHQKMADGLSDAGIITLGKPPD